MSRGQAWLLRKLPAQCHQQVPSGVVLYSVQQFSPRAAAASMLTDHPGTRQAVQNRADQAVGYPACLGELPGGEIGGAVVGDRFDDDRQVAVVEQYRPAVRFGLCAVHHV